MLLNGEGMETSVAGLGKKLVIHFLATLTESYKGEWYGSKVSKMFDIYWSVADPYRFTTIL